MEAAQSTFTQLKFTVKTPKQSMNEIWSKLTLKVQERHQWGHFGVFIVNIEQISHIVRKLTGENFRIKITFTNMNVHLMAGRRLGESDGCLRLSYQKCQT